MIIINITIIVVVVVIVIITLSFAEGFSEDWWSWAAKDPGVTCTTVAFEHFEAVAVPNCSSRTRHTQSRGSVRESNPSFHSRVRCQSLPALPFVLCSIPGHPSGNLFPIQLRLKLILVRLKRQVRKWVTVFHYFHRLHRQRAKVDVSLGVVSICVSQRSPTCTLGIGSVTHYFLCAQWASLQYLLPHPYLQIEKICESVWWPFSYQTPRPPHSWCDLDQTVWPQ